jgi:hypothetical protein
VSSAIIYKRKDGVPLLVFGGLYISSIEWNNIFFLNTESYETTIATFDYTKAYDITSAGSAPQPLNY